MKDAAAEAVIYDLDGTLLRLDVDWKEVRRSINDVVGRRISPDIVWGVLDVADQEGCGDQVRQIISEHEVRGAQTSTRLPTADELSGEERPIGVCSLNCREACVTALETHDLLRHVDVVVGRDSVDARKPHPEPLLHTAGSLGIPAEDTVFVGDSVIDRQTAESAGIHFRRVGR